MVKIYADGANLKSIEELNDDDRISGFTTNPALMKKSGITNYESFAKEVLSIVDKKPVSFEIVADDYDETYRQAKKIASWADNVYVKIPVTNTKGNLNYRIIQQLSLEDVKINATAVFDSEQIQDMIDALDTDTPSIISVFAGRIADTGRDPLRYIQYAVHYKKKNQEILWASTREAWNYYQADICNADIITIPPDILKKVFEYNKKPLKELSLETVKMFFDDAASSGLTL